MIRAISILLLTTMGVISHQLPLVWLSYKTVNARYATFYCVNPGTDCHGSCTIKRSYSQLRTPERSGQLPRFVMENIQELSSFLIETDEVGWFASVHVSAFPQATLCRISDRSADPPAPPPRA